MAVKNQTKTVTEKGIQKSPGRIKHLIFFLFVIALGIVVTVILIK